MSADADDPRVERSRSRICAAALQELAAAGFGRFGMESVAARAGVSKSTLYRHWADRTSLILDALRVDHERLVPPMPAGEPARQRVVELARHVASILADPTLSACIAALVEAAAHETRLRDALHRFTAERADELGDAVADAVAAGQTRSGLVPGTAAGLILGALFHPRLLGGRPPTGDEATRLVEDVLGTPGGYDVRAIGYVESVLLDPGAAPKQGDEGAPDAWLMIEPDIGAGLTGTEPGAEILVLTWLHHARRDELSTHPRDDPARPERGVFATRSPHRPNPVGLHRVRVLERDGARLRVAGLEAVHHTPVVDIKPVLDPERDG